MSREITWELVGIVRIYDFHMLLISPRQGKKKYHHDGTRCLFLFFRLSASFCYVCVRVCVFLFFFVQTLPYTTSIRCISILDSRNSHPPFSLLLRDIMYNWLIFERKQTQRWHNRDCVGFLFCFVLRSTFTQFYSLAFWRWASTVWNRSGFHVSALRRRQRLLIIPAQNRVCIIGLRILYTYGFLYDLEYMNQISRRWNGETFDSVSTVIIIIIKASATEADGSKLRRCGKKFSLYNILCNLISNVVIIEK